VKEDTGEIQLHLETNVHISSVDGRTPPQSKSTIRDLIETRALSIGQLLELHALLETGSFLPEQALPRWECSCLEECMLENSLNTTKGLDDIRSVGVQVPQFTVVPLGSPPKRIRFLQKR
jgi:hypothetical protein